MAQRCLTPPLPIATEVSAAVVFMIFSAKYLEVWEKLSIFAAKS